MSAPRLACERVATFLSERANRVTGTTVAGITSGTSAVKRELASSPASLPFCHRTLARSLL